MSKEGKFFFVVVVVVVDVGNQYNVTTARKTNFDIAISIF